ncbi:MAG TPA: M67 family metallopeptidase [Sphingomonas sp.]|nr:M67 family metallopeptidase [Sphingomonas sp.]
MTAGISRSLLDRLRAIVAADPRREVCGLLLGHEGEIEAIIEAANVATDPRVSFEIDPRVQIDAVKAARNGGLAIIGSYHSHPNGAARPSQWDLELARSGELWLIFAAGAATAWLRGHNDFQPLTLDIR